MGFLRRLFDPALRRARAAEGQGDYRKAAALYAEAGRGELAGRALAFLGDQSDDQRTRVQAYKDALRWLPSGGERERVEGCVGRLIVERVQRVGVVGHEEREQLLDAARRLEAGRQWQEAAAVYGMVARVDDQARCLQEAGDIEQLEALLELTNSSEARAQDVRARMRTHEMSMRTGARIDARRALREARDLAPDDAAVAEMLRKLEERFPKGDALVLDVDGQETTFVGKLPATVGRVGADIVVRGASVSRKHAKLDLQSGTITVEDLGSRNGTLVAGVAVAGEMTLSGDARVGLGDDVTLRLSPVADALVVEVVRGLDRGRRVVLGRGPLRLPGLECTLSFSGGTATLTADPDTTLMLAEQRCALPIVLLRGDRLTVGGRRVEVRE